MSKDRRDFLGLALASTASAGAIVGLYGVKRTWDALPSVITAGYTTVDLSVAEAGKLYVTTWRGKPIFILKKTADMQECDNREITVGADRYSVMIGLCTHLGCIPAYNENAQKFKCACHGGEFDACGNQTFGPPPRPLDFPPFDVDGSKIVLGKAGDEYKRLIAG